jgi:tRNA (cmo5U34)-methyltransferase
VTDFQFDPETYMDLMAEEVPGYPRLQAAVGQATTGERPVRRILDLGTGTGVTATTVLERHPEAALVGVDDSEAMLSHARQVLPGDVDLRVGRLEDPLPTGPFDLVVSALAVHHLDGPGKADLFRRVAAVLGPQGRFVLGDLVVPDDPADVVTEVDGEFDTPSSAADQVRWMADAGLAARLAWADKDLAVMVGDLPP